MADMKPDSIIRSDRQYYIDWLRILLITSVFLYHTGMIFVTWGWHVKNDVLYGGTLRYLMSFLHSWRMPLLFMISGAGTYFALRTITPAGYIAERSKKLLIPLVTGIFLLVPVQVFIEKIKDYHSLASFYPHMFEGIYPSGNFSWHHLWFIAYLFTIALLISPFLNYLRGERFRNLANRLANYLSKPFRLNLVIIPLLVSQITLRCIFDKETHDLINDWASFTYYVIFFLAGLILLPRKEISEAAVGQRNIFLAETIIFTVLMFLAPFLTGSERAGEIVSDISEIIVSWTCSVSVIGYTRKYLNSDSDLRRKANEAIYPFYLFHQPLLVLAGYILTPALIPDWLKAITIILSSLAAFLVIYTYLIRPFNFPRVIFGMKMLKRKMADQSAIRFDTQAQSECA